VETLDNVGNRINSESDVDKNTAPFNPLSGPIFVEGAMKGDCLEVIIEKITPLRGHGWTGWPSDLGIVEVGSPVWNLLNKSVPNVLKICKIDDKIHLPLKGDRELVLPLDPLIGTIGTAPPVEVASVTPGPHGGNMDCREVKAGNKLFLPVYVEGGLLFLGDIHATQGDGELGGSGLEVAGEVTLTINVKSHKIIGWPRIESRDELITVGASKPMDSAIRIALVEMISWLASDYNMDIWDANLILGAASRIRACQMICPLYTAAVAFPKAYLP
jgi:acetamidase/formamidase